MRTWSRTAPLPAAGDSHRTEVWISQDAQQNHRQTYEVDVQLGKPVDILALKLPMVENFGAQLAQIQLRRRTLFESANTEPVEACPICGSPTGTSEFRLAIDGGRYHQCRACSHCFVMVRPTQQALERFYAHDAQYAATYTDRRLTETRVREVTVPKARWVLAQFERLYSRKPASILDVGAGGGHFVSACRQLGVEAQGVELSQASRTFCRENFGFELHAVDFLSDAEQFRGVEVITFWGVIEHVPDPLRFLCTAHQLLAGRHGLVVAEVPRWHCLSTAIQSAFPGSVARHLDPVGHIHCFTDSSLATAFEASGFAPAAAWYFGMDAYELTIQVSHLLREQSQAVTGSLGQHIPGLQQAVDHAQLSDEIVLAGKPV